MNIQVLLDTFGFSPTFPGGGSDINAVLIETMDPNRGSEVRPDLVIFA